MSKTIYSVGRDSMCDIVVNDYTDVVSRNHATVRISGRKRFITDHSTNGTYINGIRIAPGVEYPFEKSDDVRLGGTVPLILETSSNGEGSSKVLVYILSSLLALAVLAIAAILMLPTLKDKFSGRAAEEEQVEVKGVKSDEVVGEPAEEKAPEVVDETPSKPAATVTPKKPAKTGSKKSDASAEKKSNPEGAGKAAEDTKPAVKTPPANLADHGKDII